MKYGLLYETFGLWVVMKQPPSFFGFYIQDDPSLGDISVTENTRLSSGSVRFLGLSLVEKYRDALIPIFDKRYGSTNYELVVFSSTFRLDEKVKKNTEIIKWRLKTSNFNPKHNPNNQKGVCK